MNAVLLIATGFIAFPFAIHPVLAFSISTDEIIAISSK
jgi:hypothetical protein